MAQPLAAVCGRAVERLQLVAEAYVSVVGPEVYVPVVGPEEYVPVVGSEVLPVSVVGPEEFVQTLLVPGRLYFLSLYRIHYKKHFLR